MRVEEDTIGCLLPETPQKIFVAPRPATVAYIEKVIHQPRIVGMHKIISAREWVGISQRWVVRRDADNG